MKQNTLTVNSSNCWRQKLSSRHLSEKCLLQVSCFLEWVWAPPVEEAGQIDGTWNQSDLLEDNSWVVSPLLLFKQNSSWNLFRAATCNYGCCRVGVLNPWTGSFPRGLPTVAGCLRNPQCQGPGTPSVTCSHSGIPLIWLISKTVMT